MRSPQVPPRAAILRTYAELAAEGEVIFGGHYDELLVAGPPRIGKLEAIRRNIHSKGRRPGRKEGRGDAS
jgi:hypothetical protein